MSIFDEMEDALLPPAPDWVVKPLNPEEDVTSLIDRLFHDNGDGFGWQLRCPECTKHEKDLNEFHYTHHERTEIYARAKEDGPVTLITVYPNGCMEAKVLEHRGIQGRRDAVRVVFSCEHCNDHFSLDLTQHKGQTTGQLHRLATGP